MQSITKEQIKKLQCMYREIGIVEDKKELLLQFTKGRTDSTAGLYKHEAVDLIQRLAQIDPYEKQKKAVIHLAYEAGIIYGDTIDDYKMNVVKLNMFLNSKGTVKKDLQKMNLDEMKRTHRQLEAVLKNNKKAKDNKHAKQLTQQLLTELNIAIK